MGQKNIIQFETNLTKPGNIKGGIDVYGEKPNGIYFSKDIDFDTDPDGIRAQLRPDEELTTSDLATFDDTPKWITEANGGKQYLLTNANEVFQNDSGWTRVNVSGQSGNGQGLVEYDDDLYYVQNSYVGQYNGTTWSDTWQSRSATENTFGPAIKFLGKFYVGSGRFVDSWDGTTWVQKDLTLPIGEIIRSFTVWNDFLVMGCSSGNIYFWNGTSETYDDIKNIPDGAAVDVVKEFLNDLYAIAGRDGGIYQFDGAEFVQVAKIPDVRDSGFDLANVSIWSGACLGWQNKILFMVELGSGVNGIRTKSGIWSFTPRVGGVPVNRLALEWTVSSGQMSTNLDGGALFFDSGSETLYIGYRDANAGSDGSYIDVLQSTSDDDTDGHYLITSQAMPAEFALGFLRRLYLNATRFDTPSTAKIRAAIRIDDDDEVVAGPITMATGGGFSTFTTSTSISDVQPGDFIEIIEGPGARSVRIIESVTSGSPNEIDVTEQFNAQPVNNQSKAMIYRYRHIGDITPDDDTTLKSLEILKEVEKVWLYLEIKGRGNTSGTRVTIKKATLDYIQRPNS